MLLNVRRFTKHKAGHKFSAVLAALMHMTSHAMMKTCRGCGSGSDMTTSIRVDRGEIYLSVVSDVAVQVSDILCRGECSSPEWASFRQLLHASLNDTKHSLSDVGGNAIRAHTIDKVLCPALFLIRAICLLGRNLTC